MDKMDDVSLKSRKSNTWSTSEFDAGGRGREVRLTDNRVAQLLVVLHEIDACINGLEQFSDLQLSELVDQATVACGFTDPDEARSAIAFILDAMEPRQSLSRTYS